jgi:hypothetical protein
MDDISRRLVFVGGLHRSGTTPFARVLANHPMVSGFAGTGVKEDEGQHLQDVYGTARSLGGPGRFALNPSAHLTEVDARAGHDERLLAGWVPHWDTSRQILIEKSPPNIVRTRFLQEVFPHARFIIVVRHPAIVALSTHKWAKRTSLTVLLQNWFVAHTILLDDARSLRRVLVIKYESLVLAPELVMGQVGEFLSLPTPPSAEQIQGHRSDAYERTWDHLMSSRRSLRGRALQRQVGLLQPQAHLFGYDLVDLRSVKSFPLIECEHAPLDGDDGG